MEGVFNYDANKALALKSGDDNQSGEDRVNGTLGFASAAKAA